MVAQIRAEHLELALVPATDQVQAKAALADMIGGDEFPGGDQWRDQRRMHRAEHDEPLCRGEEAGGPGDGLKGFALVVGHTAIPLPAADRQHELDAGLVRHLRQGDAIGPTTGPPLGHHRDGAA